MNENTNTSCSESSCGPLANTKNSTLTTALPKWHAERNDDGVTVEVTLPGVSKEGLDLQVEGRDLRLTAKRTANDAPRKLLRGSPAPESYALKLRLGESLDGDSLTAALKDGILTVTVPLASEAKARTISIE